MEIGHIWKFNGHSCGLFKEPYIILNMYMRDRMYDRGAENAVG